MNTTEKKAIVDNILELLIQLTEDGENSVPQSAKASTAGKVKSVRTGEGRNGKILVNKADLIAYFNGKGV